MGNSTMQTREQAEKGAIAAINALREQLKAQYPAPDSVEYDDPNMQTTHTEDVDIEHGPLDSEGKPKVGPIGILEGPDRGPLGERSHSVEFIHRCRATTTITQEYTILQPYGN